MIPDTLSDAMPKETSWRRSRVGRPLWLELPDPVFAGLVLGDGVAIDPVEQVLRAPCDGTVTMLHRAHHALTLRTAAGADILMHIGLDTVELAGVGFTPHVAEGQRVRCGRGADQLRCRPARRTCEKPAEPGDRHRRRPQFHRGGRCQQREVSAGTRIFTISPEAGGTRAPSNSVGEQVTPRRGAAHPDRSACAARRTCFCRGPPLSRRDRCRLAKRPGQCTQRGVAVWASAPRSATCSTLTARGADAAAAVQVDRRARWPKGARRHRPQPVSPLAPVAAPTVAEPAHGGPGRPLRPRCRAGAVGRGRGARPCRRHRLPLRAERVEVAEHGAEPAVERDRLCQAAGGGAGQPAARDRACAAGLAAGRNPGRAPGLRRRPRPGRAAEAAVAAGRAPASPGMARSTDRSMCCVVRHRAHGGANR